MRRRSRSQIQVRCPLSGGSLELSHGFRVAYLLPFKRACAVGITQLHATSLCCGQGGFGVLGDGPAHGLGHRSE
jgi:hypothetical protein